MVGPIQQKVANEAAHHIDRHVQLLPQTARQLQQMTHPRGQTVTQQLGHIALARIVLLIVQDLTGLGGHDVDEVRAGHHPHHQILVHDGHQTLPAAHDDG